MIGCVPQPRGCGGTHRVEPIRAGVGQQDEAAD